MNYQKIYDDICKRGQERILDKSIYSEKHHIVPRCLGGSNDKSNISKLTAREHFLCHWLLINIYASDKKIAYAFWMMCKMRTKRHYRYIPSSRIYEYAKIHNSRLPVSIETKNKNRIGTKLVWADPSHKQKRIENMTGRIISDETKMKIGNSNRGKIRTDTVKQKLSETHIGKPGTFLGKTHSDISKHKMSIAASKRIQSTETKKRISDSCRGKKRSQETIERMRAAKILYWKNIKNKKLAI